MIKPFTWYPIALLPDVGTGHRVHGLNMLVHAPELMDADCNPHGIAEGFWQDDGINGDTSPGAFLAPRYCMEHDEWHGVEVTPTHFMLAAAPSDSTFVTDYERNVAVESWQRVPGHAVRAAADARDLAAVEFGYRQCEKGMNLQAALEAARNA